MPRMDYVGKKINLLTVVRHDEKRSGQHTYWWCKCECGNEVSIVKHSLDKGQPNSCGCSHPAKGRARTHGKSSSSIYWTWHGMLQRCYCKKNVSYRWYGAKGVTVCNEWKNSFEAFYKDMGEKPSKKHSLDRIDNTKGYSANNCKWSSRQEQDANRTERKHLYNNQLFTIRELSSLHGVPRSEIRKRMYRGWDINRAVTQVCKIAKNTVCKKG